MMSVEPGGFRKKICDINHVGDGGKEGKYLKISKKV